MPTSLIEAVHDTGIPVIQIYGATETAPFAIYQHIDEAFDTIGSIGRHACQLSQSYQRLHQYADKWQRVQFRWHHKSVSRESPYHVLPQSGW